MHNVENWPNILKTYIQILRCSRFLKYIRSFFNIIVGSSYKSAALLKGRDFKIFSWFAKIFNLKFTFQIQYWVLNDSEPLHCKMESTKKFTNAWQPDTKMTWKFFKNNAWQQIRIEETIIAGIMLNNSWCFNFFLPGIALRLSFWVASLLPVGEWKLFPAWSPLLYCQPGLEDCGEDCRFLLANALGDGGGCCDHILPGYVKPLLVTYNLNYLCKLVSLEQSWHY